MTGRGATHAAFRPHLEKVALGKSLSEDEAREAFGCIMDGGVSEIELAAFLIALKTRGETIDEISGAVSAMRAVMVPVAAPPGAVDIVGTGGDAKGTFNISTAVAFVVAGGGVPVAKHGNRAVSSKSGSADVLESLGVNLAMPPAGHAQCFKSAGISFLWAPQHHPAMRHAAGVRQALGMRTIFNLLGPLANPAGTSRQLIGAYSQAWLQPMIETMQRQKAIHVWAVHGADGMDELSTVGTSRVVEFHEGAIRHFEVHPRDAGVNEAHPGALTGGSPSDNARSIRALFRGEGGPFRDIVLLNAAAAFIIAGRAHDLHEGAGLAAVSIDEGRAMQALDALIEASHRTQGD